MASSMQERTSICGWMSITVTLSRNDWRDKSETLDETEYDDCVTAGPGCVMSTFCPWRYQSSTQHDCIAGSLQRVVAPGNCLRAPGEKGWENSNARPLWDCTRKAR